MRSTSRSAKGLPWAVVVVVSLSFTARARAAAPTETRRALPGLIDVGIPIAGQSSGVVAMGAGYARLTPVTRLVQRGHRLAATLAVAYQPLPFWAFAIDFQGRRDRFTDSEAPEVNWHGEPRITGRYHDKLSGELFWGVETDLRLLGARAPSVKWSAASPSIKFLLGGQINGSTWYSGQLGFHFDRSERVVSDIELLSSADRLTLAGSSWNAIPWGAGVSHRLSATDMELLAEMSGQWLVGAGSPPFSRSPWKLSVGVRHALGSTFSLAIIADASLSKRAKALSRSTLNPVEPRWGIGMDLVWRLGAPDNPLQPQGGLPSVAVEQPIEVPTASSSQSASEAEPEIARSSVGGTVVDEGGHALSDVVVSLTLSGMASREERTFADGSFQFNDVLESAVFISVETAGFDRAEIEIEAGAERSCEVVLHPSVPAGQVQGRVLDIEGKAVGGWVTIEPGNQRVAVLNDGSFSVELMPGKYSLAFENQGFISQKRSIHIQDRGVVILSIALSP